MDDPPRIEIFPDGPAVVAAADRAFRDAAARAIAERGRCAVALSGGRTPNELYRSLARPQVGAPIDWSRVHLFWGDERSVPPADPQSNYGNAMAALAAAPIPPQNVHRMRAEAMPPESGADEYERLLRSFFVTDGEWPVFDLVLLGLGPDGHTASLFPGTPALDEHRRLAVAQWVPSQSTVRMTLTYPVLNAARQVCFLATGEEKAAIVGRLLRNHDPSLPAAGIRPATGVLRFLLDAAAAAALDAPKTLT